MSVTRTSIVEQLKLSTEQRPAAIERQRDIAVVAGAGSGKTRTVVARYLGLLEEGCAVHRIVAITFTRKAAREMRNRVRREISVYLQRSDLDEKTRHTWQARYEELNAARISTIHSLCAEILRAHPAEAGIDPFFEALTEGEQSRIISEIAQQTLAWGVTQEDLALLIQAFTPAMLGDTLVDVLQRRLDVAQSLARCPQDPWPAWTRTAMAWFLERLAHTEITAAWDHLFDLETSGAIAAAESAGDKLAGPLRKALRLWREIQQALVNEDWPTLTRLLPLLRSAFPNVGVRANWPTPPPMKTIKELRDWYDRECYSLLGRGQQAKISADLDRDMARWMTPLRRLIEYALDQYSRIKSARNALDFDDLEDMALRLLANPAHASILTHWRSQISALLVDEFQDTNTRQRDLIALLNGAPSDPQATEDNKTKTAGKLFIVGDGKQSIYRFRGADVTVFRREREAIRQREGLLCELSTSYRAHAPLVEGLNALMARILSAEQNPQRLYVEPFAPLRPHRAIPPQGMNAPHIECHLVSGSKEAGAMDAAADALAGRLIELVESQTIRLHENGDERPLQYGDIAILCRKSRSFTYYEDALDRAGIPYVTVAGGGFYDRAEIRDLLNLLRAITDAGDDLALVGALRSPAFAVSDAGLYALCRAQRQRERRLALWQTLQELVSDDAALAPLVSWTDNGRIKRAQRIIQILRAQAGRVTVAALLKQLLDVTHYRAIMIRAGQARALRNVDKLLMDAHTSGLVSVGEFLEYAQAMRDTSAREGEAHTLAEGAVQIMSVHAAKGLEFPIVVLGDISTEGSKRGKGLLLDADCGPLLPLQNEEGRSALIYGLVSAQECDQDEEENRRLFYVAATRAQEKLIISTNLKKPNKNGALGKQEGWMGWLAGPDLLDLENETISFGEANPERVSLVREVSGIPIVCYFYPITYTSTRRATPLAIEGTKATFDTPPLLDDSVLAAVWGEHQTRIDDEARGMRLRRIAQGEGYPSYILGQVVHDALAQWRFPGPDFDAWVEAMAKSRGVIHPIALAKLCERARRLLQRFWNHPLRERIEGAKQCWREAPFEMWWDDQYQSGRLDILWLDQEDQWRIADFKTDYIPSSMSLADFWTGNHDEYRQQVRRYVRAVTQWLGQQPIAELVLLDYHGQIHIEPVE